MNKFSAHIGNRGLKLVNQPRPTTVALGIALIGFATTHLHASDLEISHNASLGLVVFVQGPNGGPISLDAGAPGANQIARPEPIDFFQIHGSVFGVSDPNVQLVEVKRETDGIGWTHTTYQQLHAGVPVFSGDLKVHQNAAGQIMSVNGRFYPLSTKLPVNAKLTADDANLVALDRIAEAGALIERNEFVIVDPGWYGDPPMGARAAYYIVVADYSAGIREGFFVDAANGEIIDQWSMIHAAKDRAIYDGNGASGIPGTLARGEGAPAVASPEDVNRAYDYYGDTYDYYFRAFGRDSIDGAGITMVATVNSTSPNCPNAYWNGVQMVFCTGLVTDDVVGHELTHGVTQYTANLIYQNQPGQLNESYSDVFGELVDLFNGDSAFAGNPQPPFWPTHSTGPGLDSPNNLRGSGCSPKVDNFPDGVRWLLGEDVSVTSNAFRDMWNPPCRNHPDRALSPLHVCPAIDNGGVHSGSGVPNHAFAIVTDGKTFNGYEVQGIGPIKAGAIWYRALTIYLTQASNFNDAYLALNQAALDLVGTFPNDPRTGSPITEPITAADVTELNKALLAVELNTPGRCGLIGPVILDSSSVFECGDRDVLFADDFESGNTGWTVFNTGPTPFDWELTPGPFLFGRTGTAWFCPNPSIGNCGSNDQSGVHSLVSPLMVAPIGGGSLFASFTHLIWTEGAYDGGNVKIIVNGNAAIEVPRTSFVANPYNDRLAPAPGNTNPNAGQAAWSGSGGGWGETVIDLTTLVAPGDEFRLQFELSKDGCTGARGWYLDDFSVFTCVGCGAANGDGLPNDYASASPPMEPPGVGLPQAYILSEPPEAGGDVAIYFTVRGDFSADTEYADVNVNGTPIGRIYETSGSDCASTPNYAKLTVSATTWNTAVASGDAVLNLVATPDVAAAVNCDSGRQISIFVRFPRAGLVDCNANGTSDICELLEGGVTPFVDTLLEVAPYNCIYDFDASGVIDGADVQPYVSALLGS
ncbi:MAG: M4 family metallopeptidase [Phycisphaerae bacterium]|nr:M4 family metallopeptidase [Phycisphaerae bacterium]